MACREASICRDDNQTAFLPYFTGLWGIQILLYRRRGTAARKSGSHEAIYTAPNLTPPPSSPANVSYFWCPGFVCYKTIGWLPLSEQDKVSKKRRKQRDWGVGGRGWGGKWSEYVFKELRFFLVCTGMLSYPAHWTCQAGCAWSFYVLIPAWQYFSMTQHCWCSYVMYSLTDTFS